jgi:hypothetical protein
MTKPYIRVRCVLAGQVSAIQMETRWVGVSDEVGRRFRELGFIHYNSGLQVHSSLLNIVIHKISLRIPPNKLTIRPGGVSA